jgi:DNA-binding NtrC family response regulator
MRNLIVDVLTDDGFEVEQAENGQMALDRLLSDGPSVPVLVLDLSMPGIDGFEVLKRLAAAGSDTTVIVITAYGTIDTAVRAMKEGAADFLVKPFDNDRLRKSVRRCFERRELLAQAEFSHPQLVGADRAPLAIIGDDARLQSIFNMIRRLADLKTSVLITGESGTGKELVAQAIHYNGSRRDKPFVAVNCAALPEALLESEFFGHERGAFTGAHSLQRGKFEIADGGTLFLDEVGEMPLGLQAKFLRVLQEERFTRVGGEKEVRVDVRIIAATNRHLEDMVRRRDFREDLFYRLAVLPIELPPLRERRGDIPRMVQFFNRRFSQKHSLDPVPIPPDLMEHIVNRGWHGNIRELQNAVEKAVILQDPAVLAEPGISVGVYDSHVEDKTPVPEVDLTPVEPHERPTPMEDDDVVVVELGEGDAIRDLNDVAADAQRKAIIRALRLCEGNKMEAAKRLGVSIKTLYNRISELGISISTKVE